MMDPPVPGDRATGTHPAATGRPLAASPVLPQSAATRAPVSLVTAAGATGVTATADTAGRR